MPLAWEITVQIRLSGTYSLLIEKILKWTRPAPVNYSFRLPMTDCQKEKNTTSMGCFASIQMGF